MLKWTPTTDLKPEKLEPRDNPVKVAAWMNNFTPTSLVVLCTWRHTQCNTPSSSDAWRLSLQDGSGKDQRWQLPIFLPEGQQPIVGPHGILILQSCMEVLKMEFFKRNPEFSRRLAFHRSKQKEGQRVNQWADDLDRMAENCDVVNLTKDDVFVLKYYTGCLLYTSPSPRDRG